MNGRRTRIPQLYWPALFGLALLRFWACGPRYEPLLDDSIQYFNYANLMGGLGDAVSRLGLLAARPLAGLLDIALWSRFWPRLHLATLLTAGLFTLSAYVFARLFEALFGTGRAFALIYLLLPANLEATYWLSASTRILPGLLLAGLCGWLTLHALQGERRRPWLLAPAALCCLLTLGFYEQCFVLAAALMALIGLFWGERRSGRLLSVALPIACYALYGAFCAAMGPSALYGGRGALYLPIGADRQAYFSVFLPELLRQVGQVFKAVPLLTLRGLLRGLPLLGRHPLYPLLAVPLLILALLGGRPPQRPGFALLPAALLLTLAPMAPFLVVQNPWVGLRALGCCLPGLALLGDAALRLLPAEPARRCGTALVALLFLTASLSEISDYRQTARDDAQAVAAIAAALPQVAGAGQVGVLGLMPTYLADQNYEWHEHLHGVTESRWALTGALRAHCRDLGVPYVTPLRQGAIYGEYTDLQAYDAFLLMRDLSQAVPVTYDRERDAFFDPAGRMAASIERFGGGVYLTLLPE
ncbi:MAG: hypothetical protein GXX99_04520 [Clostridiales bacterium]|nr:hypothetical protein [Clostridiales bacterium]